MSLKRLVSAMVISGLCAQGLLAGQAKVTVEVDRPGIKISPTLYGVFFEEINRAGDGGIYAEMVQNRAFEDDSAKPTVWTLVQSAAAQGSMSLDTAQPLNAQSLHSLKLEITKVPEGGRVGISNDGFRGMSVKQGAQYNLTFYARGSEAFRGPLKVTLESADGKILAETMLSGVTTQWRKLEATLLSNATDPKARLVISSTTPGTIWLDVVSLFPKETWKGRANGLRPDLMGMIEKMKPAFVRFPGGCYVEGDRLENAFRWKKSIGDIAQRPGHWNMWGYRSTDGLGFYEYLQMCEDLKAEPLFVINCGMSHFEQNDKNAPPVDVTEYVQDALDAIEYANGPADSKWGSLRAKAGHPAPFNLKYMEIGNENGGPIYAKNYAQMRKAIKDRYPQMQLVACDWWGHPDSKTIDILDEHLYTWPRAMMEQADKFDRYPRDSYRVYVGEYAVTSDCGQGNLIAALAEAAYMTGLERNSDVVTMASYAPLLCNPSNKAWNPNAINFDSARAFGTPSYHVQAMFGANRGDVVLPVRLNEERPPMHYPGQIGLQTYSTQAEFKDIKVEKDGKLLYQSDFAKEAQGWRFDAKKWRIVDGALRQDSMDRGVEAFFGESSWVDYTLSLKARKLAGEEGFILTVQAWSAEPDVRLNLGGWGNREHALMGPIEPSKHIAGSIETGRWYDIRLELKGSVIRAYLDGKLILQTRRVPPKALYATASRENGSGDLILKVVNVADEPMDAALSLQGVSRLGKVGKATVLTSGSLKDENSFDRPENVAPKESEVTHVAPNFRYTFVPHSVTVLRLPAAR